MRKKLGLLGRNIAYSLSPRLHHAALAAAGLDWEYRLLDTEPANFPEAVDKLRRVPWLGANVTVPYKEAAMDLLDEIDPLAGRIGAVNTIVNRGGYLVGYNTDVTGLARDLQRLQIKVQGEIAILGAGGAAAAVLAQTLNRDCKLKIICRRQEQGRRLAERLRVNAQVLPWEAPSGKSDLLFNCTPPGSGWQKHAVGSSVVYDINYHDITRQNYHNGLGMLVFQAAESFQIWTGFDMVLAMAAAVGLPI
ncbi:MAG: shikimate dehydrogenase family protein [Bacillota bacterium]|jgi:shikimate dehydrogenase